MSFNPYDMMINDLVVEAECLDDEDDDIALSVLSKGETDKCISEVDYDIDDDEEDELFDDEEDEEYYD